MRGTSRNSPAWRCGVDFRVGREHHEACPGGERQDFGKPGLLNDFTQVVGRRWGCSLSQTWWRRVSEIRRHLGGAVRGGTLIGGSVLRENACRREVVW